MPDTQVITRVSEKIVASSAFVITNGTVAGAPALPGNHLNLGGWELNAIALGTNALIQFGKLENWFPDLRYARWYAVYLGAFFTTLLYGNDDWRKWLLNMLTVIALIMINYPLLNKMEVLKAGVDNNIPDSIVVGSDKSIRPYPKNSLG